MSDLNHRKTITFNIDLYWWMGFIFSILFHGLVFYYIEKDLSEFVESKMIKAKPERILVDLDLKNPETFSTPSRILSKENLQGKGKISETPLEEQHLIGKAVAQADNINQNTSSLTKFILEEKTTRTDKVEERPLDKNKNSSLKVKKNKTTKKVKQKKSKVQPSNPNNKNLAIETENSKKLKFWFQKDDQLQINTETSTYYSFYLDLKNILQDQFQSYVRSGGRLNYYFVQKDEVSVIASIDKEGVLYFKERVKESESQPYLNYMVKQVVDQPIKTVSSLPQEFLTNDMEKINFIFSISFSGQPLRQWWMGFDFINLDIE